MDGKVICGPMPSEHVLSAVIARVPHDAAQRAQAKDIVEKSKDLDAHYPLDEYGYTKRRRVTTHAIDNVEPEVLADRDDGVYVEKMDGGYKVSVTIADVAGQVPADSPLALVASNLGFTRYRPEAFGGNDPMFPANAEAAMSLEHQQDRLGLSVIMELDEEFQLQHTSFEPVIAQPDNVSYDGAARRIAEGDEQFTLMQKVSQGIFKKTFNGNNRLLRDAMDKGDPEKLLDEQGMRAAMMVASYMLLANHAAASFFERTGLPFAYRVFDGSHQGATGMDRAVYAPEWTEHSELKKIGLPGAYCHFTSPIRRGPDYYNGLMVHYACEVKRKIEERVWAGTDLDYDREAEHLLWNDIPEILHALQEAQHEPDNEAKQLALKERLRQASVLLHRKEIAVVEEPPFQGSANHLYNEVMKLRPPIKKSDLIGAVKEINTLNDLERDAWRDPALRAYYKSAEYKGQVHGYAASTLAQMDKREFSEVIRKCVLSGELPEAVHDEVLARAKDDPDHRMSKAWDAMHILIAGRDHEGKDWERLRKAMIRAVRADLSAVNNILDLAELTHHLPEGCYEEIEKALPTEGVEARGVNETPYIRAAILRTEPEREAAPFYSIGYDHHSALTHARYSFLEHYAFKDLHPVEEAALPNLLYADIGESAAEKEAALKRLVEEQGGEFSIIHRGPDEAVIEGEKVGEEYENRHFVAVRVRGEDFGSKDITARSYADTREEAAHSALRKLLSKPKFKHAVQALSSRELDRFMQPEKTLREAVASKGWDIQIHPEVYQVRSRSYCDVKVSVYTDIGLFTYEATAQNTKAATNEACMKALLHNPHLDAGIHIPKLAKNSWLGRASVAQDETSPPARNKNRRETHPDGSPRMPEIRVSLPEGAQHKPPSSPDAAEMRAL